ncbi:hypothetical protein PIB30_034287 [Stylosanthes scabra]|uniref:CCHC-type domain-containing protein n=1 Tax=Stylosanthes scabra TaxID=79078 RepID=A0ABU6Z9K2_9FABA|nr:hypothetical protein [Stylosanthes scabra]
MYRQFTCPYCGARGHTKRSCSHRKADDLDAVLAATAVAAADKKTNNVNNNTDGEAAQNILTAHADATEIELTQPTYSQQGVMEQAPPSNSATPTPLAT